MTFYQIECITSWVDNDLSMTINGKVDDLIGRRTFDQYFDKYIIIDFFRKIECVSFICRYLSNPKFVMKCMKSQVMKSGFIYY